VVGTLLALVLTNTQQPREDTKNKNNYAQDKQKTVNQKT